mmetsp:Transcript_47891/g.77708  ORF Transcript_47891/g.77708 Transcript_47891/m.77708 type:complete len:231 (-) Transcript_47891:67-759(-)
MTVRVRRMARPRSLRLSVALALLVLSVRLWGFSFACQARGLSLVPQSSAAGRSSVTARHFMGQIKLNTPDLLSGGQERKDAALKLANAKKALEDRRESTEGSTGLWYRVITEGVDGIGIRETPALDGHKTGEDLVRGKVFEVDDVIEQEGERTWLRLKDGRGWVFDNSPVDLENPSAEKIEGFDDVAELEEAYEVARREFAEARGAKLRTADEAQVSEAEGEPGLWFGQR